VAFSGRRVSPASFTDEFLCPIERQRVLPRNLDRAINKIHAWATLIKRLCVALCTYTAAARSRRLAEFCNIEREREPRN